MSRLIFPAWVPDHATLEYVLPRLFNPTMTPPDFVPSPDPDENPQQWMLGRYVQDEETGLYYWRMNRDVRLSFVGSHGVITNPSPLDPPYEQDEEGNDITTEMVAVPGIHVNLWAIGKPLHDYLMHHPVTGGLMPQTDVEGNLLPIYDRTCMRMLLGEMVSVPETEGVAAGIVGTSTMKLLDDRTISTPRLVHQ